MRSPEDTSEGTPRSFSYGTLLSARRFFPAGMNLELGSGLANGGDVKDGFIGRNA